MYKNNFLHTFLILIFSLIGTSLAAQQVWPVQVTGSMIPPRSLDLSVYGNERAQDLFFNVLLNDPTQATLQTRLQLSIENNGQVLYQTDPNFAPTPILLSQFQMQELNGSFLQQYLRPNSLVGANNTGIGTVEIPEGFNQICVEIYGIDRNVPVSNKFCVQGSFQLNQAPQLLLPACNDRKEMPATQNMTFNWAPMHLGSANAPGAVEYEFELVQLPDGTYNANDAFENALKVYRTTTMTPSILYTQAEPQLYAGKVYAWRVKSYSAIHNSSKLFQNNGYSEVCTFMYYEGEEPGTEEATFSNPAPTACEVFNTDFGIITNKEPITIPLTESDKVKVGYFTMEVVQAFGGAEGFSGTGKINVPMLNTKVNVEFSGLKINSDWRAFEMDKMKAIVDQPFQKDIAGMQPEMVGNTINEQYFTQLSDYFNTGFGTSRLVSKMNLADPSGNNLPVALDQNDKPSVAVIGMHFSPKKAFLQLASWKKQADGPDMRFAAIDVPATPHGIRSNSQLQLLNNSNAKGKSAIIPAFELAYAGTASTRMDCDCKGYKDLNLEAAILVSDEIIKRADNDQPVLLELKDKNTAIETYTGEVKKINAFKINGIDDITFEPKKGQLDLSADQTLPIQTTTAYSLPSQANWRGLVINDITAKLDKKYNFINNKEISLKGEKLFIDENKVAYGKFAATNILSFKDGKFEKWAASVDTLSLVVKDGKTQGTGISGQLQTPVFKETFAYNGHVTNYGNENIQFNTVIKSGNYTMPLWNANLAVNDQSNVALELKKIGDRSIFYPSGDFSGMFSLNQTDETVKANLFAGKDAPKAADIQSKLGVNNLAFAVDNLSLTKFRIDPFAEAAKKYTLLESKGGTATIGGAKYPITSAELVYKTTPESNEILGFKLHLEHHKLNIAVTLWANTLTSENDNFEFASFQFDVTDTECECTQEGDKMGFEIPKRDKDWYELLDKVVDTEYAHLFQPTTNPTSLDNYDIDTEKENWQDLLRQSLIAEMDEKSQSSFPVLENGNLVLPWFDQSYKSKTENGNYVLESAIDNYENITFDDLKDLPADKLPIDISSAEMMKKLGMTGGNHFEDTDQHRLLITGLKTTGTATDWSEAIMELTIIHEVKVGTTKKFLQFKNSNVKATRENLHLGKIYMDLTAELTATDENGYTITYLKKDIGANTMDVNQHSFAVLDCADLMYYNIQADFKMPYDENKKMVYRPEVDKHAQASFRTTIRTVDWEDVKKRNENHLDRFITKMQKNYNDEKEWNYSFEGGQELVFVPEDKDETTTFEAYIDYDPERNDNNLSTPDGFRKGIVFKQIAFTIPGMLAKYGDKNETLTMPIKDVTFNFLDGNVTGAFSQSEMDESKLGGWEYQLDTLHFEYSNLSNKLYETPVSMEGKILVPIFDKSDHEGYFDSGQLDFEGTIGFEIDAAKKIYAPKADLTADDIEEKTFHSTMFPTIGFGIEDESTINFTYNKEAKEFEASCTLNGSAGIYLAAEIKKAIFGKSEKLPPGVKEIDLVLDVFSFEGFKINTEESSCKASDAPLGIKSLSSGTWGTSDHIQNMVGGEEEEKEEETGNNTANNNTNGNNTTNNNSNSTTLGGSANATATAGTGKNKKSTSEKLKGFKDGLMGFPISISNPKLEIATTGSGASCTSNIDFTFNIEVNLMNDDEAAEEQGGQSGSSNGNSNGNSNSTTSNSPKSGGGSNNTGSTGKGGDKKTQTAGVKAAGIFTVESKLTKADGFKLDGFKLNCLNIEGKAGPLEVDGGLQIFQEDNSSQKPGEDNVTLWGNGFKGYLSANLFETISLNAVGQYGTTRAMVSNESTTSELKYDKAKDKPYRYFFVELEGMLENGILVPPPTPANPSLFKFYGAGLGFRYNMFKPGEASAHAKEDAKPSDNPKNDNDAFASLTKSDSKVKDVQGETAAPKDNSNEDCGDLSAYLTPGIGLINKHDRYYPRKGGLGFKGSVIVGPPTPPNPGTPPTMVGDVFVDVQLDRNNANTLSFYSIDIGGFAYLMPESLRKRREDNVAEAYARLQYNFKSKLLDGEMRVKAAFPKEEDETFIAIPAEGDFAKAKFQMDFKNKAMSAKIGSWIPQDEGGLGYISCGLKIPNIPGMEQAADSLNLEGGITSNFYLQFGNDVDPFPPLEKVFPELSSVMAATGGQLKKAKNANTGFTTKGGNGILAGGRLEVNLEASVGPVAAKLDSKIGMDLGLIHYDEKDILCTVGKNTTSKIGLNNWYAQAQAYAYLDGALNLEYDFYFKSGSVEILKLLGALTLEAKFPNPSWFRGRLMANYSVLDGLIDGRINHKLEFGEKCEGLLPPSPVKGMPIFAMSAPENNSRDISVFSKVDILTNMEMMKAMEFPKTNKEGEEIPGYDSYRPVLKNVIVKNSRTGQVVDCKRKIMEDGFGYSLEPVSLFEKNTNYIVEYEFIFEDNTQTNNPNEWRQSTVTVRSSNGTSFEKKAVVEKGSFTFSTGEYPDRIEARMLASQAPGYGQRYWHKGYATPLLRFSPQALGIATELFPKSCVIENKSYDYQYFIEVGQYAEGNKVPVQIDSVIVESYPTKEQFEQIKDKIVLVGGKWELIVQEKSQMSVDEVLFSGLDDINFRPKHICRLRLIRTPKASILSTTNNNSTNTQGDVTRNVQTRSIDSKLLNGIAKNTKIIYEYHFAISQYPSLAAKFEATQARNVVTKIARNDFSHPLENTNVTLNESIVHATKDDYFAITTPGAKEGFDQYDLDRIRRNAKVTYLDNYGLNTKLKERYHNKNYSEHAENNVNYYFRNNSAQRGYIKTVLRLAEEFPRNTEGTDGSGWNFNFYIPNKDVSHAQALTNLEIENKKMAAYDYTKYQSAHDNSSKNPVLKGSEYYHLLFQDLRSRIVLNQMRILSRLGYKETIKHPNRTTNPTTEWNRDNYPASSFFKWVGPNTIDDYNWIRQFPSDYVAEERGHKYSYHGRIQVEFPKMVNWTEMKEVANFNQYPTTGFVLKPNRVKSHTTTRIQDQVENDAAYVSEMSEVRPNKWYAFAHDGKFITNKYNFNTYYYQFWLSSYIWENKEWWFIRYPIAPNWNKNPSFGLSDNEWFDNDDHKNAKWQLIKKGDKRFSFKNRGHNRFFPQNYKKYNKGWNRVELVHPTIDLDNLLAIGANIVELPDPVSENRVYELKTSSDNAKLRDYTSDGGTVYNKAQWVFEKRGLYYAIKDIHAKRYLAVTNKDGQGVGYVGSADIPAHQWIIIAKHDDPTQVLFRSAGAHYHSFLKKDGNRLTSVRIEYKQLTYDNKNNTDKHKEQNLYFTLDPLSVEDSKRLINASILQDGIYEISVGPSDKNMYLYEKLNNDGNVNIHSISTFVYNKNTFNKDPNLMKWKVKQLPSGLYTIQNLRTKQYLSGSAKKGHGLYNIQNDDGPWTKWRIIIMNGYYRIQNTNHGKEWSISLYEGRFTNDNAVNSWDFIGHLGKPEQQFHFHRISLDNDVDLTGNTTKITGGSTNYIPPQNNHNNVNIDRRPIAQTEGLYKLKFKKIDDKRVQVRYRHLFDESNVFKTASVSSDQQTYNWALIAVGHNKYRLVNSASGKDLMEYGSGWQFFAHQGGYALYRDTDGKYLNINGEHIAISHQATHLLELTSIPDSQAEFNMVKSFQNPLRKENAAIEEGIYNIKFRNVNDRRMEGAYEYLYFINAYSCSLKKERKNTIQFNMVLAKTNDGKYRIITEVAFADVYNLKSGWELHPIQNGYAIFNPENNRYFALSTSGNVYWHDHPTQVAFFDKLEDQSRFDNLKAKINPLKKEVTDIGDSGYYTINMRKAEERKPGTNFYFIKEEKTGDNTQYGSTRSTENNTAFNLQKPFNWYLEKASNNTYRIINAETKNVMTGLDSNNDNANTAVWAFYPYQDGYALFNTVTNTYLVLGENGRPRLSNEPNYIIKVTNTAQEENKVKILNPTFDNYKIYQMELNRDGDIRYLIGKSFYYMVSKEKIHYGWGVTDGSTWKIQTKTISGNNYYKFNSAPNSSWRSSIGFELDKESFFQLHEFKNGYTLFSFKHQKYVSLSTDGTKIEFTEEPTTTIKF